MIEIAKYVWKRGAVTLKGETNARVKIKLQYTGERPETNKQMLQR